jgi:amino acid adenylation domain-containing protein
MSMISDLYKRLRELNITVDVTDGRLDLQAPKGVLNNELLDEIKMNKEQLIGWITAYKEQKQGLSQIPSIPVQADGHYLLSANQRRMWMFSRFEEGSSAYNIYGACLLEGELIKEELDSSVQELFRRHEILRTTFVELENGELRQLINSEAKTEKVIPFLDLCGTDCPEERARQWVQKEIESPFDLEKGPLLRVTLVRLEERKHLFIYVMHHIVSDGWSMNVLIRELQVVYLAGLNELGNTLEPMRIQYKDFSAWQLNQIAEGNPAKNYWKKQLSGNIPVMELPFSQQRPRVKTFRGAAIRSQIDQKSIEQFKDINQKKGITLFTGLLSVVNVLLHRYTGDEDMIIGTPVLGREHADLENQIGYYSNTLALRTWMNGNQTYEDHAIVNRKMILEAFEHQTYPFDALVEDLALKKDTSRDALFDIMISFQEDMGEENEAFLGNLKLVEYVDMLNPVSKFDLTFEFTETRNGLEFLLEYNTDLFDTPTAHLIQGHFENLLREITKNPFLAIGDLNYLSKDEITNLLIEIPVTSNREKGNATVVSLFENQVEKTPDSIALVFENHSLTYKELNAEANKLAAYLRRTYSIATDDLIGIKLERSEWMLIAILGVMKSGGAYVPLDPKHPENRTNFIVADCQAKLIINEEELSKYRECRDMLEEKDGNIAVRPDALAYCIYTSGSTGEPKGVAIAHRSLHSRILTELELLEANADCRTCLTTNYVFDVSLLELFMPLVCGGRIIIPPEGILFSPKDLGKCLAEGGVTVLQATPGFVSSILLEISDVGLKLKTICIGGESLNSSLVESLKKKWPPVMINNHYGPSECTIDAIVNKDIREFNRNIIGRPLPGTSVIILDGRNQLVPVGVFGEICIGGIGLARNYVNRPELTREKFIPHPFKSGKRIYRTGDIGRWTDEGTIEFSGRKDDQVKVRGYRIELGEIESSLLEKENISEAIVMICDGPDGMKELTAYFVSAQQHTTTELRRFLKEKLPEYMIPDHFVQLDHLPLTSNGKVDKQALPSGRNDGMPNTQEYIAPRNEMEEKIVEIAADLLGKAKERIGVTDNFFDMGINSIKLMQLLNRINRAFNLDLKIVLLFQYATIEELVEYLTDSSNIPVQPVLEEVNVSEAMDDIIDLM